MRRSLLALCCLVASACTCQGSFPQDAGTDAGEDSGVVDAGADAGPPDAGPVDAGPHDAGVLPDAGVLRCLFVACVGDTTCSTDDGECRCNGVLCSAGQTCTCPVGMPGCQPGERVCEASTRCDGISCMGGAICDLADGLCKCGGAGGPSCSDTQTCGAARPVQCVGGCAFGCEGGMSCDADDGACKCGGRGGLPCAMGEVCVSLPSQYLCRLSCAPNAACPQGQGCFIDTRPTLDVAYCEFPSGLLAEGESCTKPTQCFDGHPLHCAGLSDVVPVGTCREACDPSAPSCPSGRHCVGLADVRDAGFCVP